jgi:predicted nucleic acid-binding protein
LKGVLIDTSAWIETLRTDGDEQIRATVTAAVTAGLAVLCDLVLLELWNGARGDAEQQILGRLEENLECVPTTPEVWTAARALASACRSNGWTVPATDLLIAACAQSHGLDLIHRDGHFDAIADAVRR